jgi:hypothetical protein
MAMAFAQVKQDETVQQTLTGEPEIITATMAITVPVPGALIMAAMLNAITVM